MKNTKLVIVVPCYNEEEVLHIAAAALRDVLDDLISKNKISEDSFVLFVNDPELLHFSYQRYIENKLRDAFGFDGSPIRILARKKD